MIDRIDLKLERSEFSSNFEFDRNMLSGTGAWSVIASYACKQLWQLLVFWLPTYINKTMSVKVLQQMSLYSYLRSMACSILLETIEQNTFHHLKKLDHNFEQQPFCFCNQSMFHLGRGHTTILHVRNKSAPSNIDANRNIGIVWKTTHIMHLREFFKYDKQ